jgi:enamine deaminase RidA (YjgF/YER057c/UK114 family)
VERAVSAQPTPHRVVNPAAMAPAVGFAHAVVAAPGRIVFLGGQTAQAPDGSIVGTTVVEQWDSAAGNLVAALEAAGGRPEHLTSVVVYTTDLPAYRASLSDLGRVYRRHFGRHYPAMALLGVGELFDPDALVELVATAVVPD